ncbi:hypothetical protein Y032_0018g3483 [Ancylostoma ceylanicum]|uniref:BPTI/Kunitz inhibitor domain-containing protein n=1 Tax=Ancylostoma ceylanicum TaxID=53326 RepID=A0A016V203_9BILA|nr:hypothetical protein Y032_0018g3483 [Ancylostoma ceylanicum]
MRWQNLCALILQITSMFALITPGTAVNCQLPRDKGYSCDEPERTMFYFDMRMGVCQPMMHRGCGGNENKFDSAAKCKEQCIEKKGKAKPSAPASKGAGLVGWFMKYYPTEIVNPFTTEMQPSFGPPCSGGV